MDIVTRIVLLPLFFVATYFALYIPGQYIGRAISVKFSFAERVLVNFVLGIVLLTFGYIVAGLMLSEYIAPILFVLAGIYLFLKEKKKFVPFATFKNFFIAHRLLIVLFLFGIYTTGWFMFRGGVVTPEGVYNAGPSYHDSLWHLSLIAELKREFPPQVPTIAGESLKNYHYFSDVTTAAMSYLLPYDIRHLYFFHMPLFIIILVGLCVYVVTKKILQDNVAAYVAVGLTFFGGSFAYVLPFIFGFGFFWHESSFWVSQTVSMTQNPPFMFSVPILLTGLFLISEYQKQKKLPILIAGGLVLASLVGFKVYGFIVGIIGFSLLLVWQFVRYRFKEKSYFIVYTVTISVALLFMQLLKGPSTGNVFIFMPLWYMRALVEHTDRMPFKDWVLREDTYIFEKNWLRVIQLRLQELAIFTVGNLGVRVVGLLYLLIMIGRIDGRILNGNVPLTVMLLFCLLPATILPLLFIQNGSVASTIQFWYYTLIIMNIFTGVAIALFLHKKSQSTKILVLSLLFIFAIPTTLHNMYVNRNGVVALDRNQYDALAYLKKNTPQDAVILVKPDVEQLDKAYVSAFSQRRTFLSYNQIAEITKVTIQERKKEGESIFAGQSLLLSSIILRKRNIDYIYDIENTKSIHSLGLPTFYSNEYVTIYRVVK